MATKAKTSKKTAKKTGKKTAKTCTQKYLPPKRLKRRRATKKKAAKTAAGRASEKDPEGGLTAAGRRGFCEQGWLASETGHHEEYIRDDAAET